MSRWQPNARERLEEAALALFVEQGFSDTTVPQITERAGLTTRTFFRHFADKREVLFVHEHEMPALAAQIIAEAPASLGPTEVIAAALETVAEALFEGGAEQFVTRHGVIVTDEGLKEREMQKLAALSAAIRVGFVQRGVDPLTSTLMAEVTLTVFGVSIGRWLAGQGAAEGSPPLAELVRDTLASLRTLMADPGWQSV